MTEALGARGGIQEFNRHWLSAMSEDSRVDSIRVLVTGGQAGEPATSPDRCEGG